MKKLIEKTVPGPSLHNLSCACFHLGTHESSHRVSVVLWWAGVVNNVIVVLNASTVEVGYGCVMVELKFSQYCTHQHLFNFILRLDSF